MTTMCKIRGCEQPAELCSDRPGPHGFYWNAGIPVITHAAYHQTPTGGYTGGTQRLASNFIYPTKLVNGKCRFHNLNRYFSPFERAKNEYLGKHQR